MPRYSMFNLYSLHAKFRQLLYLIKWIINIFWVRQLCTYCYCTLIFFPQNWTLNIWDIPTYKITYIKTLWISRMVYIYLMFRVCIYFVQTIVLSVRFLKRCFISLVVFFTEVNQICISSVINLICDCCNIQKSLFVYGSVIIFQMV